MDQVRPEVGPWHSTTRTLDWSTYPLKPHQVAASALTPYRSMTPANGYLAKKVKKGIDKPRPVTEAQLEQLEVNFSDFA
jgi:hypothetical protein